MPTTMPTAVPAAAPAAIDGLPPPPQATTTLLLGSTVAPNSTNPTPLTPAATDHPKETLHPFVTEVGDHAETPIEAYKHIAPLLARLSLKLNKSIAELVIYDPYYCEGRTVSHMRTLGFESIINRNEDFYAACAAGTTPEYVGVALSSEGVLARGMMGSTRAASHSTRAPTSRPLEWLPVSTSG
jgi:hypothetical protein